MLTIFKNRFVPISAIVFVLILCGCSTSSNSVSSSSGASANAETKTPSQDSSTAQKKISMAIGQEMGEFTITSQQKIDAPAGYEGTQYAVKTNTGKSYKCEILEMSGFGKAMTWGMGTGASAMCTDFTKGSADAGKTNKASCNALLKAAGRC
jgi:hypothetical protein